MPSPSSPEPPSVPAGRKRSRALRLALLFCAGLAALIVAFFLIERIRGRSAWHAYEKDALARGTKLHLADFIPPPVPDEQNFASIPIFAAAFRASEEKQAIPNPFVLAKGSDAIVPRTANPLRHQTIDLAAWQAYFVKTKALPAAGDNAAHDVLIALERYAPAFAQLSAASARPHGQFPVQWEDGFTVEMPHQAILMGASHLYALRLCARLAVGDSGGAFEDFRDGLRISTATSGEPSLISGVVRVGTATLLVSALWNGLAQHQWSAADLVKIEAELARVDWLRDYQMTMGGERAVANSVTDEAVKNREKAVELLEGMAGDSRPKNPGLRYGLAFYPTGWFYQGKVRMNRYFDDIAVRVDPAQRRYFPEAAVLSSPAHFRGSVDRLQNLLFALIAPAFETVEQTYLLMATVSDQARVACALERFRLESGSYPAALQELVPAYLPALPLQIVNGEPHRYRRADAGDFLLYSIGPDLRDDGGTIHPELRPNEQPDWVWSYP